MNDYVVVLYIVISFAGDALICIFPELTEVGSNENDVIKSRQICCLQAVQCAKILTGFYTNELTAHVGISYGPMSMAKLGGYDNQWVYLMNGGCISSISSCVDDAKSRQVVISSSVYENLLSGNIS